MITKRVAPNSRVRVVIILVLAGLIIAILEKSGSLSVPKSFFASIFNPIQLSIYRTYQNISHVGGAFVSIGSLHQKNTDLELENATLKAENSRLKDLEAENAALREQLSAPKIGLTLSQVANVVGFGTGGNRNNLLIDKGSSDKVKVGDFVVLKNLYVGRIREVQPKSSRVQLITDPDTKIPAVTSAGALGVVVGQFGTESHLANVIQDDKLNQDDLVFTSGEAGFPKGLVIGRISEVRKVSKELFQDATLQSLLNLNEMRVVFVMEQK